MKGRINVPFYKNLAWRIPMKSKITKTLKNSKIVQSVTAKFTKRKTLSTFAKIYIESLPEKSLKNHDLDKLSDFIKKRFDFFQSSLSNLKQVSLTQSSKSKDAGLYTLEMAYPDAPFLLVTLEALFKKHTIHITQLHHPIFTVNVDSEGNIIGIEEPKENNNLVSLIYIEFEQNAGDISVSELEKEIKFHMDAIIHVKNDHNDMIKIMTDLKPDITHYKGNPVKFQNEWVDLLDWLKNYNYSFFGYCAFEIKVEGKSQELRLKTGSGKGILSSSFIKTHKATLETLKKQSNKLIDYRCPFIFDTISETSPIQRFENFMRLSLKIPTENGSIIEHNFLGLLKQSSLLVKNIETPIIRQKIKALFEHKNLIQGSYDFNQIIRFCTATPKFELFQTPTENILELIEDLLSITNPNDIHCFTRKQIEYSRPFLMVCVPPELFSKENIKAISDYLSKSLSCDSLEVIEARNEKICRLHIYFNTYNTNLKIDTTIITDKVRDLIRPWEERLKQALQSSFPGEKGHDLHARFSTKFPNHHKVRRTPEETVRDICYLAKMEEEKTVQFNLATFHFHDSVLSGKSSILYIYNQSKLDLINIMPILQNFGIHIYDELTVRIGAKSETLGYIHSFRVADKQLEKIDEDLYKTNIIELLKEIFKGRTLNDPLNALVVTAGLSWRHINVIQAYRGFYLQLNTRYSKEKITATLLRHTKQTRMLAEFFEAKFSPDQKLKSAKHRSEKVLPQLGLAYIDSLATVTDITADIILKRFLNFIESTLRTNFYIHKENGDNFISLKLESPNIKLPLPVPYREIFIYDSEMEGCHLRFGPVARGGLRWSDRIDDFRREVLGLVKAQQTKNVVIVPVGSKGGFVIKKDFTRETAVEESQKQYKKLIKGLLDITDNLDVKGTVIHPENVMRYDGNDPYLVVAADKGTAQFSDIANSISDEYNFWLGDGFASGGSNGYNHKEVAITAKGAWECVKLHFKEMGVDCQKNAFTVAGVGDMSGDVFGNGMLLSPVIKLQAAFNHMHIFLDPNPDIGSSFKERERLFNLPRSSWSDYNTKIMSKGSGVFDRESKNINLSKEIQSMLGIKVASLTGDELIRAVLKMQVDLMWFGGIGTYVKNDTETHFQVGDPASDTVRIDHTELNAKVVGEGANLGITQSARISLSLAGTKLNTDFIDNSAGVNMSDYEVNIKILLKRLLLEKKINSTEDRNTTLEKATNEVTELVLKNNRGQHRLISMDAIRSTRKLNIFKKMIQHYISTKLLNPAEEVLLDHNQFEDLTEHNTPLPRPVLATLQAYTKMSVFNSLITSPLLDSLDFEPYYIHYLPEKLNKAFGDAVKQHRLKKEIIATVLTNKIVNQAGITFFYQAQQITGQSFDKIAMSYIAINKGLKLKEIRKKIFASSASSDAQYEALIQIGNKVQDLVIDLLQVPGLNLNFSLIPQLEELYTSIKKTREQTDTDNNQPWLKVGFSHAEAQQIVSLSKISAISDLLYFNIHKAIEPELGLQLTMQLDKAFGFEWIKQKINDLPLKTQWEYSQKDLLLQAIRLHKTNLVKLLSSKYNHKKLGNLATDEIIKVVQAAFPDPIDSYFKTLSQLRTVIQIDLTSITVTITRLNNLASQH